MLYWRTWQISRWLVSLKYKIALGLCYFKTRIFTSFQSKQKKQYLVHFKQCTPKSNHEHKSIEWWHVCTIVNVLCLTLFYRGWMWGSVLRRYYWAQIMLIIVIIIKYYLMYNISLRKTATLLKTVTLHKTATFYIKLRPVLTNTVAKMVCSSDTQTGRKI